MNKTITLAGLALAAVTLAGCGGGAESGGSGAPSAAAPTSSAASSAATTPEASSTPAATPSESTGSGTVAEVIDPCTLLDADEVQDLTGVKVKKGTTQDVGGSNVCTWLPANPTKSDAAVFSAQEGPIQGSLDQVEGQLKDQFDGKVSKLTVEGADEARYVTGKKSGLNVIDVIAQKDEVFYQILVATPRDAGQHKAGAIKIAEALLKR